MRCRLVSIALALVAGCSTDNAGLNENGIDMASGGADGGDDAFTERVDIALAIPDMVPPNLVGTDCPMGNECGDGALCISSKLSPGLPPNGFCTKPCVADGDCGPNAFCGPALPNTGPLCFVNCDANGSCAAMNRVCARRLNGTIDLVKTACVPGNRNAVDGAACKSFGDCNRNQVCLLNPFDEPGGMCLTIGCTLNDSTTCSPAPGNAGICVVPISLGVNACVAGCASISNCRANEGYTCNPVGGFMGAPMACSFQHAAPGSACLQDIGCGAGGTPWRCLAGKAFPKGYCSGPLGACNSLIAESCPRSAHCYDPTPKAPFSGDEYCTADCTADKDCRMADGYSCQFVDAAMTTKGCRL